jgi:mono/diheme cytochrome c family protein
MTRLPIALIVACVGLCACQSNKNNSAWSTKPPGGPSVATATPGAQAPSSATSSGKGVGPVDHVDLASLDDSKEDIGAKLFQEKCSACHKIEERYIGPALAGVTQRRQPEWILNMILNPEVMIKEDPTAKGLLATYIAPMANQHLTREEAECILVYFREHDEEAGDTHAGEDDAEEAEGESSSAVGQAANGH